MSETAVSALARTTLAAHQSLYLATAGASGPWVNGVFFAEADLFTLVLVLEQRGRTLAAIRENPVASVIVSTGSPADPFLQASVRVEILDGDEAQAARDLLVAKVPYATPFLDTPIETVRLHVDSWRVTDIPNGMLPGRELAAV
ncbi:pyridoxamine 5'-phosphate oxidase family protein [Lentzea tibetensis]|uniref:Pyridoxamine 5'-phosphate oxidase family protein n=1 Tax=Lentzea tibetensis TaxID=2591470 RepID=A0A563EMK4_9PSEU|nr:pyridoxamine 5'-phosphate oxidase family protein [Lentzea tibetensis]TWP48445.1 pyridoxamine 5'-phosphate oxidase family protein [Lentzea tibetensis]